ncbi:MAG: ribose 5-phosphate isomerase B [Cyclobacteriaceae bacterium]|nr:ribose 5-phosphate isomerase B [Cyclobacteriaceae bacterium]MCK5207108.1 ribose 5-phosphate isomerase B [Cyclobacteriaceae bacterium]MCK5280804.1 ribose 5-phosphate isomerase B [Cyclobacteriaceae bacterium]MCK5369052.1 ribose 5-phosphate isomerase B [Cyclobacteriaceae bacterium]MCK5470523.1 ribose 5-phosphate isomerase B [Cyclobacteriaceae bacterium]
MKNLQIAIGSDHAGFELKSLVKEWLDPQVEVLKDLGTNSEESVDYPDFAHAVAGEVEKGNYDLGILICGTGIGVDMTANKHQGIRSALCWNKEISKLAKTHNNANIISLPGRFITFEEAKEILDTFFNTNFEGGRHSRRINKISC